MPGPPVTIGCSVVLSPGASGPPDTGTITIVLPGGPVAGGMPLATLGSICLMINSITGVPYPLPIGTSPSLVKSSSMQLVRLGDSISSGPGMLTILGPPAAPYVTDNTA